jgi:hypothetical protein
LGYSIQFKQREKRLLKIVTVNTKRLYFVVRRLSNVGDAVPPKMAERKTKANE